MLTRFDWLRRSRTGPELLATMHYLNETATLPTEGGEPGPPPSALFAPCARCWIYPRGEGRYCPTCQAILDRAWKLRDVVLRSTLIWGYVNHLPTVWSANPATDGVQPDLYIHDNRHFLLVLRQRELKPWLQELALRHGGELKGLLQVFPTAGHPKTQMGDVLAHIIHHETRFPPDRLRIRFLPNLTRVFKPGPYEKEGVITFEIGDFLNTLELAAVFRTMLKPDEQKILYRLLHMTNTAQAQLYWGRFWGALAPEARDMLSAWGIRTWSLYQVNLLYELVDYVALYQPG
ncbi:MAG: hypothetical protein WHX53_11385 [Anaerolineae bacterium]